MPISLNLINPLQPQVDDLDSGTSTAQQTVADQNQPTEPPAPEVDPKVKKRNDEFRTRIDSCKQYRRKLIANWTISIDYRRGKPFISQTDEDQVAVNLDWTYTKAKQAALFSQVPKARLVHTPDTLPNTLPWIPKFERELNDKALEAGIEAAMEETLPDCINAAGIGVAIVSYESITEDRDVPSMDMATLPDHLHQEALTKGTINGEPVPTEQVPHPIDHRYVIQRISPSDLLWPINFTGSNFNQAPWLGRSGRVTWEEAVLRFNLDEKDRESILGEDKPMMDKLTHDIERDKTSADAMVGFDEIFYREFQFDKGAQSFGAIHHLVFVNGKDDPVVDEPWKGQKLSDDDQLVGAFKYPIQVLTLSYLTDEAIPPSDSAISRPQVNELNKSRTQQIQQRQRSLPVRWVDINRTDPAVMQSLMRGTWQSFIPVQGDGQRVIGEVARASMPVENFKFDDVAKGDIQAQWAIGSGSRDLTPEKTDAHQLNSPFVSALGRERAKVASFFCNLVEVLGGLMCLYEDPQVFGQGFNEKFSRVLKFSILADSTVLLDAEQRLARLNYFMNAYAKTGWVSLAPVLSEIASIIGLDASAVVQPPKPKPPVEPNISLRLTGVEDMLNPLTLAFLIKSGQAPPPAMIEQAKQLIQQAVVPPQVQGQPQDPNAPPQPPGMAKELPIAPPTQVQPGGPVPHPAPPPIGEAHPQLSALPSIVKRTESGGKQ